MKPSAMVDLLEAVAAQLSIKVSYETLNAAVGRGGLCRVKHAYRIIIDKRATDAERVTTLASALASFDTADLEVPDRVREVLRAHEGSARIRIPRPVAPIDETADGAAA